MDPEDFIQQCAQEDQAVIHDYVTSSTANIRADSSIPLSTSASPGSPRYDPPVRPFNVSTRLVWNCAAHGCSEINSLSLCSACKVVQYCGHAHLYFDRPNHRSVCSKIKKAQTNLDKQERALRHVQGESVLEGGWGLFRETHASRKYMRARYTLVEGLLKINTAQAVISSLEHLLDMLRLNPPDTLGARDVVPALYLRLGRDQDAYDFCHWWATTGHAPSYDWASDQTSYLATKNADIFVEVDTFTGNTFRLSHVIAITLLKLRLIIDLQCLQRARTLAGPHVPRELLEIIQQHSTTSAITNNNKITDHEDHMPQITTLREQVETLFMSVHEANRHFWLALVEPGENLEARPTAYEHGDERQMQLVLQHSYNAWSETPGAIDVIRELLKE